MLISAFKPMEDVNVRRAIAMAIDKQALVDVLGGGAGQTGFTLLDYHHIPWSRSHLQRAVCQSRAAEI